MIRQLMYMLKATARDKGYWFWAILFPIIIATLFIVTTQNISNSGDLNIEIGIDQQNPAYDIYDFIDELKLNEMELDEAKVALKNENIVAYINNQNAIIMNSSGTEQTIVESIVSEINQSIELNIPFDQFDYDQAIITKQSFNTEPSIIMFFALIALTSFYSMFNVFEFTNDLDPKASPSGIRFSSSPHNKFETIFIQSLGSVILNFINTGILIIFLMIVYQNTLFAQLPETLLLIALANIAGLGFGFIINLIPNISVGIKGKIAQTFMLVLSFLSGLAGPTISAAINDSFPLLNSLNPYARLTNTMYRINFLNNYSDYLSTVVVLICIGIVGFVLAFIFTRRQQYDSI